MLSGPDYEGLHFVYPALIAVLVLSKLVNAVLVAWFLRREFMNNASFKAFSRRYNHPAYIYLHVHRSIFENFDYLSTDRHTLSLKTKIGSLRAWAPSRLYLFLGER